MPEVRHICGGRRAWRPPSRPDADSTRQSSQLRVLTLPPAVSDLRELPLAAGTPSGQPQLAVDAHRPGRGQLAGADWRAGSRYAFKYAFREGPAGPRRARSSSATTSSSIGRTCPRFSAGPTGRWARALAAEERQRHVRLRRSHRRLGSAERNLERGSLPYRDTSQSEHGFASFFDLAGGTGVVWLDGREMVAGSLRRERVMGAMIHAAP